MGVSPKKKFRLLSLLSTRIILITKRRFIIFGLLLTSAIIFPAPEFFDSHPYVFGEKKYEQITLAELEKITPLRGTGELQIGVGRAEITAEIGQPLMGFSRSRINQGTGSKGFAQALTVQCGAAKITIVGGDLFLWLPELASAVIEKSGLTRQELYFTATHTHSGGGGWARGWLLEFFYGQFKQAYFDQLVKQFVAAIQQSRAKMRPAKMFYQTAPTANLQNRIYPHERPAREIIEALIFRDATAPEQVLATLAIYAAHATMLGGKTVKYSADYPGGWRDFWEQNVGGMAFFAAGNVGDARTNSDLTAADFGAKLGEILRSAPETPLSVDEIISVNLTVTPPRSRLPLGKNWQLFPLCTPYFFPPTTQLSVLKIGAVVLVGLPGDVAGEMAADFARAVKPPLRLMMTDFNGDWRGYFTTATTYENHPFAYEVRMGLLGKNAGAYFVGLTQAIMEKIGE